MSAQLDALERLAAAVLASPKYRSIDPDFVRAIGGRELAHRRDWTAAVKATKSKLHQVVGAYQGARAPYAAWLDDLRAAHRLGDDGALRRACRAIMSHHAATRERLPILDQYYATICAGWPPIRSVLDLACGLHPLTIPWMPLAPDVVYAAYDVDRDLVAFLNAWFDLLPVQGVAHLLDVTRRPPAGRADVALLLKALPSLDQVDSGAAERLLTTIDADCLLVSYPVHSLSGRGKGMAAHYEARFRALVAGRRWSIERHRFPTELVFVVRK